MRFSLGDEYHDISEKALTVPKTTAELMSLIDYVNEVQRVTLIAMEDRLQEVLKYMLFLSDHKPITPVEIKQNSITVLW